MKTRSVMTAGVVALFTMPLSAQAQGIGEGARQGARTGYYAAGPVGGIVGGAVGGVTGGVVGGVQGVLGIHQYRYYNRRYYRHHRH